MDICCVIPASEKNRYSTLGDLATWGNTTLLEWKLAQVREVKSVSRIVISTSSAKVAAIVKEYDVEVVMRSPDLSLPDMYVAVAQTLNNYLLLWTNPTAPFLGSRTLNGLIEQFVDGEQKSDGIVTVKSIQEYLIDNNGPVNFLGEKKAFSRTELKPMFVITNGAYLISAKSICEMARPFGVHPLTYEVNWLESLEIRDTNQMRLFPALLSKYFEGEF